MVRRMTGSPFVLGIDGGGSTVRAAVVSSDLQLRGQSQGPAANPGTVGRESAAQRIQDAVRAALDDAGLEPGQIAAVGIGVAGAAAAHAEAWLRAVVRDVLPGALVAPSADYEIALVGALGRRRGVLVLAGTGSLAYGMNAAGESALAGGWGYLLGDEGGGCWLGLEGLRAVIRADDGSGPETSLSGALLAALEIDRPRDLIPWLYGAGTPRTQAIAALAPIVLEQAAAGDAAAQEIIARAAHHLAHLARTVISRLSLPAPDIAFAGGLLGALNPLSAALCRELDLPALPVPRHPPVIGAARLALDLLDWHASP